MINLNLRRIKVLNLIKDLRNRFITTHPIVGTHAYSIRNTASNKQVEAVLETHGFHDRMRAVIYLVYLVLNSMFNVNRCVHKLSHIFCACAFQTLGSWRFFNKYIYTNIFQHIFLSVYKYFPMRYHVTHWRIPLYTPPLKLSK